MKRREVAWLAIGLLGALLAAPLRAEPKPGQRGRVLEALDAGPYTYVRMETGSGERWIAGPKVTVSVGDTVEIGDAFPMRDFPSKTLNRTFERIDFTSSISVVGSTETSGAPHSSSSRPESDPNLPFEKISVPRAPGGKTIAELYAGQEVLANQRVAVRGRVVKYTPNVMGRNWIHIQDGTGAAGKADLTVTTRTEAKIGDAIVAKGELHTDRDFGAGYRYELIIEDAEITIE